MEYTTAEEYLAGKIEKVVLPSTTASGKHPVFIIRKIPPKAALELASLLELPEDVDLENINEALSSIDVKEKLPELIDIIIPACVVKPRIKKEKKNEECPKCLCIDDLEIEDLVALFEEILEFNGLTAQGIKKRQKFRRKPSGSIGRSSRSKNRKAAD
ncbi:MAG: hypothetical protein DRJ47_08690 [Thermoprotei archaeon]|nr:MAG: hypothetical protein DRJ47_08690 [Thermoprotei archaeon]